MSGFGIIPGQDFGSGEEEESRDEEFRRALQEYLHDDPTIPADLRQVVQENDYGQAPRYYNPMLPGAGQDLLTETTNDNRPDILFQSLDGHQYQPGDYDGSLRVSNPETKQNLPFHTQFGLDNRAAPGEPNVDMHIFDPEFGIQEEALVPDDFVDPALLVQDGMNTPITETPSTPQSSISFGYQWPRLSADPITGFTNPLPPHFTPSRESEPPDSIFAGLEYPAQGYSEGPFYALKKENEQSLMFRPQPNEEWGGWVDDTHPQWFPDTNLPDDEKLSFLAPATDYEARLLGHPLTLQPHQEALQPTPSPSFLRKYHENHLPPECAVMEHDTSHLDRVTLKLVGIDQPLTVPSGRKLNQFDPRIPDRIKKEAPAWYLVMLQDIDPRIGPTDLIDRMHDIDWSKEDPKDIRGMLNCMSTAMQRYRQEHGKLSVDKRRQGGTVTKSEMHAIDKLSAEQIRFNCVWEVDGKGNMRQNATHPWVPAPCPMGNYTSKRVREIKVALEKYNILAGAQRVDHWSKLNMRWFQNDKNRKGQDKRRETLRVKKEEHKGKKKNLRRRRIGRDKGDGEAGQLYN
ncbi:hypothetical protein P152DRAFT_222562 [Eremomyces bilateralis CBS 781.70]|uniref:Uncharacterized protein n=1 Tax=Eremomyces bilateralis CBS 781.70 TaxID=1392243 RepID=A0A6G1FRH5_9PEZI|nr:uncharacterized protein P152DRAFT_222562 [Eremomyces bilateralis CBS 781.70]KAF1808445.1 hypothetical protein P152DRAFT_222562 [Eremomyces bilateralis CBS 781.70]